VYLALHSPTALSQGLRLAQALRAQAPTLSVLTDTSNASIKSQLKRAENSRAPFALMIDEDCAHAQEVSLRTLGLHSRESITFAQHDITALVQAIRN
jgi:histidyl-tRNA synthetase